MRFRITECFIELTGKSFNDGTWDAMNDVDWRFIRPTWLI